MIQLFDASAEITLEIEVMPGYTVSVCDSIREDGKYIEFLEDERGCFYAIEGAM